MMRTTSSCGSASKVSGGRSLRIASSADAWLSPVAAGTRTKRSSGSIRPVRRRGRDRAEVDVVERSLSRAVRDRVLAHVRHHLRGPAAAWTIVSTTNRSAAACSRTTRRAAGRDELRVHRTALRRCLAPRRGGEDDAAAGLGDDPLATSCRLASDCTVRDELAVVMTTRSVAVCSSATPDRRPRRRRAAAAPRAGARAREQRRARRGPRGWRTPSTSRKRTGAVASSADASRARSHRGQTAAGALRSRTTSSSSQRVTYSTSTSRAGRRGTRAAACSARSRSKLRRSHRSALWHDLLGTRGKITPVSATIAAVNTSRRGENRRSPLAATRATDGRGPSTAEGIAEPRAARFNA